MSHVLRHADGAVAFATTGPFVIAIWRGVPTRERLELGFHVVDEHALAMGTSIGVIAVVEEGSPPPGPEEMLFLGSLLPRISRTLSAAVGVFETTASGLESGRSEGEVVGGALGLLVDAKLCFAVEEACAWIVPRTFTPALPLDRRELARTIEEVRESLTSPRAEK